MIFLTLFSWDSINLLLFVLQGLLLGRTLPLLVLHPQKVLVDAASLVSVLEVIFLDFSFVELLIEALIKHKVKIDSKETKREPKDLYKTLRIAYKLYVKIESRLLLGRLLGSLLALGTLFAILRIILLRFSRFRVKERLEGPKLFEHFFERNHIL